jgi:hypothetical protein
MFAQGHDIVLAMDANTAYDPDTTVPIHPFPFQSGIPTIDKKHDGTLATLVATCGLSDPLAHQLNSHPFPPSHIRESKWIDFILLTSALLPRLFPQALCLTTPCSTVTIDPTSSTWTPPYYSPTQPMKLHLEYKDACG